MENSRDLNKLMVRVEIVAKELEFLINSKTALTTKTHQRMMSDFLKHGYLTDLQIELMTCILQLTEADITIQDKAKINAKCKKLLSDIKEARIAGNDMRADLYEDIHKIHLAGIQFDTKQCNLNNDTRILLEALTKTSSTNSYKIDNQQQHMQNMHGQYVPELQRIERKNRSFFFSRDCLQRENDFEI